MTMFCTRNYGNGCFQAVVCNNRIASDFDDEEFETFFDPDGTRFELRQRGVAEIATNPTGSLSDKVIQESLSRAVQNATDFESKEAEVPIVGHFLSHESRFVEHQQLARLAFTTEFPKDLPTFARNLKEIRSFEDLVYGQEVGSKETTAKVARLTDDLISMSAKKRLWSGLCIPICFTYRNAYVVGIVELPNRPSDEATVKWVDGPDELVIGTELFCPGESNVDWRFAIVK
jgi:hypothetical protein